MKHLMADIYSVNTDTTDTVKVNEIMNRIINTLGLKAVMPNANIPYYYCTPVEDGGITSFCLLDNGHITIHTFPFYGICYLDIMFDEIDFDEAKSIISELFNTEKINFWFFDRDAEACPASFNPENGFGPHVLACADSDKIYSMDEICDLLETIPQKIGMNIITRPVIVRNRIKNHTVLSGIIIIAESHISFHQNIETGKIYFDIYSCKFCDKEILYSVTSKLLGKDCDYQLISRGEKQTEIVKSGFSLTNNGWRSNI